MDFFAEINGLPAETILSRVELKVAKIGNGYVCPICGHGKGGDGIKPEIYHGQLSWHCYGCGRHMSNYDLCCAALGLNADDKAASIKELKELFGLDDDNREPSFSSTGKKSARTVGNDSKVKAMDDTKAAVELKSYAGLLKFCRGNVKKYLAENGGQVRGLKPATFERYSVGIHNEFEFTDKKTGEKFKANALIIPYVKGTKVDEFHFVARSIGDNGGKRGFKRIGQNAPLYEPLPIELDGVNFIVESEIDALSIAQVYPQGFGCVATGGTQGWKKVVPILNERFANAEQKPRFIVMYDNDEAGDTAGKQLVVALHEAGYPAKMFFLEGDMEGTQFENPNTGEVTTIEKVDANDLLQRGGGVLAERLVDAITGTEAELEEQAALIKDAPSPEPMPAAELLSKEKSAVDVDGIASCSIAEYFTDVFSLDVARTEQYAERKTGFENLDNGKLVLVPGLYLLGGLPAAGKTTFAWQLLNQLADNGEYCVYCSYEMSRLELFAKSVSRELFKRKRVGQDVLTPTSFEIRSGRVKRVPEVIRAVKDFSFSKAQLHVAELSNMPVEKLFKWLEPRIAAATKSPVIVLDYLQILPSSKDSKREGLDDTLRRLKDFQRTTDATFIVISSFNRQNYWSSVNFESFKESGGIEYSADVVLGLETSVPQGTDDAARKKAITDAARKPERMINLVCLKNRNGAPFTAQFKYFAAHDYFEPVKDAELTPNVEDNEDIT